jgi:exopolysaccharide production protein ExoZ
VTPSAILAPARRSDQPLRSIQTLRAAAALGVLWFHIGQWMPEPKAIGASGVDLFFVISGFVLWLAVTRREPSAATFLRDRAVRILPLYWLATLAVVALVLIDPANLPTVQLSWPHLLASLALIPHNDPAGAPFPVLPVGWSLTYEAVFYALVALSLMFAAATRFGILAFGLICIWLLGYLIYPLGPLFANPLMLEFLAGAGLARLYLARRLPGAAVSLGLAGLGLGLLAIQAGAVSDPGYWRALMWGGPMALIVAAAVGLEAAGQWRDLRIMSVLGDASYSLYLWHWPIVWLIGRAMAPHHDWTFAILAAAACIMVGLLSRQVLERPSLALLKQPTKV